MATYNGANYLKEQLDSIYNQTYKNIEVIVTDDCSTDGTVEILEQYVQTHGLKYYVNEKNLGFVKNFEKAISLCEGEYIALADQDDVWLPEKLKTLMAKIGSKLMIHSDCFIINAKGEIVTSSWKKENGYMVSGTVLMHRNLLDSACPFPRGLKHHDWWLALCAATRNSLKYTDECLIQYREHVAQETGRGDETPILRRVYRNVKRECLSGYKTVLEDAITYFENYLNCKIHLKTFYISMKYHKILYPYRNYLYAKNILMDIVG